MSVQPKDEGEPLEGLFLRPDPPFPNCETIRYKEMKPGRGGGGLENAKRKFKIQSMRLTSLQGGFKITLSSRSSIIPSRFSSEPPRPVIQLQEQGGPGSQRNKEVLELNCSCRHHAPQISPNSLDFNCSILWSGQVCSSGSGNSHPALKQSNIADHGGISGKGENGGVC